MSSNATTQREHNTMTIALSKRYAKVAPTAIIVALAYHLHLFDAPLGGRGYGPGSYDSSRLRCPSSVTEYDARSPMYVMPWTST